MISIHVPRVGDDLCLHTILHSGFYFNPRPPRGGRQADKSMLQYYQNISIHVPRVGDDGMTVAEAEAFKTISIHVPRVGDDYFRCLVQFSLTTFQSTSPAWGTTNIKTVNFLYSTISIHVPRVGDDWPTSRKARRCFDFNPRPPRGGRPRYLPRFVAVRGFQSTSPAWGTTCSAIRCLCPKRYFNPRPPRGGRRPHCQSTYQKLRISIHVPRVGDDSLF